VPDRLLEVHLGLRRAGLLAVVLLAALATADLAQGEVEQGGNVIVAFDGGITPRSLPRSTLAPVAVSVDSSFRAADGADPPPQLQTISIGINRAGEVFDRGLPRCKIRRIQPATIGAARRICGAAIVGSGNVGVRVRLPNQPPFTVEGPMLVFNGKPAGGHRRILAQVYSRRPPSAFVLTFRMFEQEGVFGTVIKTTLPQTARKWAYVTHFDMKLQRTYTFKGKQHSYVSAGCSAPAGFPGAVYPFARARFGFAGGNQVTSTLVRDCKVR
jgi:hypothetical protein